MGDERNELRAAARPARGRRAAGIDAKAGTCLTCSAELAAEERDHRSRPSCSPSSCRPRRCSSTCSRRRHQRGRDQRVMGSPNGPLPRQAFRTDARVLVVHRRRRRGHEPAVRPRGGQLPTCRGARRALSSASAGSTGSARPSTCGVQPRARALRRRPRARGAGQAGVILAELGVDKRSDVLESAARRTNQVYAKVILDPVVGRDGRG